MGEDQEQIEIKTPFFSGKIAGKNLTIRDVILLFIFGMIISANVLLYGHVEGADKTGGAVLKEIEKSNKASLEIQKSVAFYQCRTACLLEQPQDKKDGPLCDRICAPLRPQ